MGSSHLITIENGKLKVYAMDDRPEWIVGREAAGRRPDICLESMTVSRRHGRFVNKEGIWMYIDALGTNGTVLRGERLKGRMPWVLDDGDVFIFGAGSKKEPSGSSALAIFTERELDARWGAVDTEGSSKLTFSNENESISFDKPMPGQVVSMDGGLAVYMGEKTFVNGKIKVSRG